MCLLGTEVAVLQEWYERHWDDAEDVSAELLRTVERHVREFSPYEVFAQSLHHLFRDAPSSAKEWEERDIERGGSKVFKLLDRYQQDGYRSLISIAERHNGAFLCDGVGLGKTFIGMMLLERLVHENKSVALIVPKAARKAVWEAAIRDHCPDLLDPPLNRLKSSTTPTSPASRPATETGPQSCARSSRKPTRSSSTKHTTSAIPVSRSMSTQAIPAA